MMKQLLLFGAGKSATVLIDYLLSHASAENWKLTVVDADQRLAADKIKGSLHGKAVSFDISDHEKRESLIQRADIVISLLPPALHYIVATDCLKFSKNLLTASYISNEIRELQKEIKDKGLLFLCEMGLDPGIDHMSGMKIINSIRERGGKIISFKSHCGGLIAPESDDNPWHYKISWSPRNVVLAGKAGARFRENGKEVILKYEELYDAGRLVHINDIGYLSWYPNRDSLSYATEYGLENISTLIRTTLRHPDFISGWKNVIDLKLTDETPQYETDNKTLHTVFKEHLDKNGFGEWLQQKLEERFSKTKEMLDSLMKLMEFEEEAKQQGAELPESFMAADDKGNIQEIELDNVKNQAAGFLAHHMYEANLALKQLFYLGLDDQETKVNRGLCSPADILQFAMEKKLALQEDDNDMVVMLHETEYELAGRRSELKSSLVVKGENSLYTAMAKTVGLPLGIAVKLILNGRITATGLHIPIIKDIYEPVLKELEEYGIRFHEEKRTDDSDLPLLN